VSGSMLRTKDWSKAVRRALTPTEIVMRLAAAPGWRLAGDGPDTAIEKTFTFAGYDETMAFVNAVAFVARTQDHHPEMTVGYAKCVVRWTTHSVRGITDTDFDCAARIDALLA
jgi:4a-hydroxytetrahydrobiopterin dehydratase